MLQETLYRYNEGHLAECHAFGRIDIFLGLHSKGITLATLALIRLGRKRLEMTNSQDLSIAGLITTAKSFCNTNSHASANIIQLFL